MSDTHVADLASQQHGLVRRDQALHHLTPRQIDARLRAGRLVVVHRGVMRVAGAPVTWRQRLLAACWATGGVASHRAAAALWGMRGVVEGEPEILVPSPRWARLPGVRCHRSNRLRPEFVTGRDGIPVATPERTILDMSAVAHPVFVERLLADAVRSGLTTVSAVRAVVDGIARRGRRRVAVMRAILEAWADVDGRSESAGEAGLVRLLVDAGLPRPVQQLQVVAGGHVFVLDLAYPAERVAIEYDGWGAHGSRTAFDADRSRDNALQAAGWDVYRFTSRSTPTHIVQTISSALTRFGRARTTSVAVERGKVARSA